MPSKSKKKSKTIIPEPKGRYNTMYKRSRYIPNTKDGVFNYGAYYNQRMREQDSLSMNTTLSYLLMNKLMKGEENNRNAFDVNELIDFRVEANQQMEDMANMLQAQNNTQDEINQQLTRFQNNLNQNLADILELHQDNTDDIMRNIRNGNNELTLRLQNVENRVNTGLANVDLDLTNIRNTTTNLSRSLQPIKDIDLDKLNDNIDSIRRGVDLSSYRTLEGRRGHAFSRDETYQHMVGQVRRDLGLDQDYGLNEEQIDALEQENQRLQQEDDELEGLRRRVRDFVG